MTQPLSLDPSTGAGKHSPIQTITQNWLNNAQGKKYNLLRLISIGTGGDGPRKKY